MNTQRGESATPGRSNGEVDIDAVNNLLAGAMARADRQAPEAGNRPGPRARDIPPHIVCGVGRRHL